MSGQEHVVKSLEHEFQLGLHSTACNRIPSEWLKPNRILILSHKTFRNRKSRTGTVALQCNQ